MHIVNVMFGKGLGGIEQALVDYCEALKMEGHKVTAIISKKAKIKPALLPLGVNILEVKNLGSWDFFAKAYIKKIMAQANPDAVIVHGNRAISLVGSGSWVLGGKNSHIPIIGVTHNYSIKQLIGLDAIIATTEDLKKKVIEAGQKAEKVLKIPNMVRVAQGTNNDSLSTTHHPLTIGTMGRFVAKKGFDVYIRALADLKGQGLNFKAVIGGGGEEEDSLKGLAAELGLIEGIKGLRDEGMKEKKANLYPLPLTPSSLSFLGWIEDKTEFFNSIDIFVLPSLHEPFGIILLEAFAYKKPVVVADSEGPSEIVSDGVDAVLVPKGNSKAMAGAILRVAKDAEFAKTLSQNAFAKALTYDIKPFASLLSDALKFLVKKQ